LEIETLDKIILPLAISVEICQELMAILPECRTRFSLFQILQILAKEVNK